MPDSAILTYLTPSLQATPEPGNEHRRVCILDTNAGLGEKLARDLGYFGYQADHFEDLTAFLARLDELPPDVIICDVAPSAEEPGALERIRATLAKQECRIPMLCVSDRDDFESRLAAAQAGADAYLVKPVDLPSLVDHLTLSRRHHEQPPYRILIAVDEAAAADRLRAVLTAAGLHAEAVSEPMQFLEAGRRLQPSLILMDLARPLDAGLDLARALRLHADWRSTPIIYLAAEDSLDAQIRAMENGVDNLLPKSIASEQLVAAVQARAGRACQLSEMMAHDRLTGLYSHVRIKEQLTVERARAMRAGSLLSVAMVDIDALRSVNETHGYPIGDQVIKALARFLRQHLRQHDSIGRYGGEEFAVILPDCSDIDAEFKFNDIREGFKRLRFGGEDKPFSVSISAGIAYMGHMLDTHDLILAADGALNAAKRRGHDRVCVEGDCMDQPLFV